MQTALFVFFATQFVSASPTEVAIDTVLVCPAEFRAAMDPWMSYRRQQGHGIATLDEIDSAEVIRGQISRIGKSSTIKHVLIVGDVPDPDDSTRPGVPTFHHPARVSRDWGADGEIASDNRFVDFDGDDVPDATIGRLPVDSVKEVEQVIGRILRYENDASCGVWRRQINFVAGVGGFGALTDSMIEMATRKLIDAGIPTGYRTTMTYASWRSPFCPDPRSFRDRTIKRLNEGCLFWVYMGHGSRRELDWIRVPTGVAPILQTDDSRWVQSAVGSPVAVFLSCHSGAFAHPEDCLAEHLLRQSGGPVAIVAGTGVTLPYGMAVLGHELLDECFGRQTDTLGEILLRAKRRTADHDPISSTRRLLDSVANMVAPHPDRLEEERREHLLLFNLLGDPLLRVRHGKKALVTTQEKASPGEDLKVRIDCDVKGSALIELVCGRGRHIVPLSNRAVFDSSDAAMKRMNDDYSSANQDCWMNQTADVDAGSVVTTLKIPENASGPCHVRVYIQNDADFALGAANVYLRRAKTEAVDDLSDSHQPTETSQ